MAKAVAKRDQRREISREGLKRQDAYSGGRVLQNKSQYCALLLKRESLTPDSDVYRALLGILSAAIAPLQALHQQAVETLAPSVRDIIAGCSRDARLIEHTLDHLLDHACSPQGLAIFKSPCRYYLEINPQATASYVSAYREMWDSDDQKINEAAIQAKLANDIPHI